MRSWVLRKGKASQGDDSPPDGKKILDGQLWNGRRKKGEKRQKESQIGRRGVVGAPRELHELWAKV